MPLIIICGLPSSGKTYRAKQLTTYFEKRTQGSVASPSVLEEQTSNLDNGSHQTNPPVAQLSALNLQTASANDSILASPAFRPASTSASGRSGSSPRTPAAQDSDSSNRKLRIHYISDHSCHLPRSIYASGASKLEKDGRATLYSAVKRVLGRNDLVILDSGNYIKGWRYQLHCEAKNAGTGSCVVHVGVPADRCRALNDSRIKQQQERQPSVSEDATNDGNEAMSIGGDAENAPYDPPVFDELVMRFEEPNPMARWDKPLFTVPWDDSEPPCEDIWQEMVEEVGKDGLAKVIRPNQATMAPPTSASNHLYELDRTTQAVVSRIREYQQDHPDEGGVELTIPIQAPNTLPGDGNLQNLKITLPIQSLSFPQLQRLRRQFISLHRQQMGSLGTGGTGPGGGGLSKERVGELFVGYLEAQWDAR